MSSHETRAAFKDSGRIVIVGASLAGSMSWSIMQVTLTWPLSRMPPKKTGAPSSKRTCGGVIHVTRAALPILRKQRSGHVVQFSSIGGRTGSAGLGPYQSSVAY